MSELLRIVRDTGYTCAVPLRRALRRRTYGSFLRNLFDSLGPGLSSQEQS